MKKFNIRRWLLIVILSFPVVAAATEKFANIEECCYDFEEYALEEAYWEKDANHAYTRPELIKLWFTVKCDAFFNRYDQDKRSRFLFKAITKLDLLIGTSRYGSAGCIKARYDQIAALAFKDAGIITVEEYEEYMLIAEVAKVPLILQEIPLYLKKVAPLDTFYDLYYYNTNTCYIFELHKVRYISPNLRKIRDEISQLRDTMQSSKIYFKDIAQFNIDSDQVDIKQELIAFYQDWLPEDVAFGKERNIEIEALVNHELFLQNKLKIVLNKANDDFKKDIVKNKYQKEANLIFNCARPVMVLTNQNLFLWTIREGDKLNGGDILNVEKDFISSENTWNFYRIESKLRDYYGKNQWEMEGRSKRSDLINKLFNNSESNLSEGWRLFKYYLSFDDTESVEIFPKKELIYKLCDRFISDAISIFDNMTGYGESQRAKGINRHSRALSNTLMHLEKRIGSLLDEISSENGAIELRKIFPKTRIADIYNEVKNNLPPLYILGEHLSDVRPRTDLSSGYQMGDKHAIYIMVHLLFNEDEIDKKESLIKNIHLLSRLEMGLQYRRSAEYNRYLLAKNELFPNTAKLMELIENQIKAYIKGKGVN